MLRSMSAKVLQLPVRPPAEPWADRIHRVIDHVEALLEAGDAAEVVDLCQRAVWYLEDSAPEIAESAPLYDLAERLGELHLRACRAARPDPVDLARWLFETEFRGDLGAVAGAAEAYVDVLGPTGLAELRRLADAAWRGRRGCSDIARSIDRFRLKPIMASLARASHPSAV
jgi:predicted ATPase